MGAKLIPVDIGVSNRLEIWLTYHPDLRNSSRHMVVVEWLRRIFDPARFPWFAEKFIHPNDLVGMMSEHRGDQFHGGGFVGGGARRPPWTWTTDEVAL